MLNETAEELRIGSTRADEHGVNVVNMQQIHISMRMPHKTAMPNIMPHTTAIFRLHRL